MAELGEIVRMLVMIGGFMTIVVGVNYAIRWTNRRLPSDTKVSETIEAIEERLAELEERQDVTERVLGEVRQRQQLPPRS